MNSEVKCSLYSGCRATCLPQYQFPNGETQITIVCRDGIWEAQGADWANIPSCERRFLLYTHKAFAIK